MKQLLVLSILTSREAVVLKRSGATFIFESFSKVLRRRNTYTQNAAFRGNPPVLEESTINFEKKNLESETWRSFVFFPKVQSLKGLTTQLAGF